MGTITGSSCITGSGFAVGKTTFVLTTVGSGAAMASVAFGDSTAGSGAFASISTGFKAESGVGIMSVAAFPASSKAA
jgi:hypothetical protein